MTQDEIKKELKSLCDKANENTSRIINTFNDITLDDLQEAESIFYSTAYNTFLLINRAFKDGKKTD